MISDLTSIIIINYNTAALTGRLLQSLKVFCANDKVEVIVIDNGSTEDDRRRFEEIYSGIKTLSNPANLGFARAANQGAALAAGEYLWFVNSDCELVAPILPMLKDTLKQNPGAAAVTPRTMDEQGRFHSVCRRFPTYGNLLFSRGSLLHDLPFLRKYASRYTLPDHESAQEVEAAAGTALLIKKADFLAVNGFDTRFFIYFEDTDLCLQLHRAGRRVFYQPAATIRHLNKGSAARAPVINLVRHHISALEYFLKWHPGKWLANGLLFIMLSVNLMAKVLLHYVRLIGHDRH